MKSANGPSTRFCLYDVSFSLTISEPSCDIPKQFCRTLWWTNSLIFIFKIKCWCYCFTSLHLCRLISYLALSRPSTPAVLTFSPSSSNTCSFPSGRFYKLCFLFLGSVSYHLITFLGKTSNPVSPPYYTSASHVIFSLTVPIAACNWVLIGVVMCAVLASPLI